MRRPSCTTAVSMPAVRLSAALTPMIDDLSTFSNRITAWKGTTAPACAARRRYNPPLGMIAVQMFMNGLPALAP